MSYTAIVKIKDITTKKNYLVLKQNNRKESEKIQNKI